MDNHFLGRGWSFPPAFYAGGADVAMVSGEQDISQSLKIILSTSLNERIMHADFGCELSQYLFEEIDQSMVNGLRGVVSDAILNHEPRIRVEEIEIRDSAAESGLLIISIDYLVRSTNNRYNMVYPYYINEATL